MWDSERDSEREIHSMLFNKDMKMKEIWEIMRKYNVHPVRKMNISEKYWRFWINNPTKNFKSEKTDFGAIVYQDKLDNEKNDEKHEKKREIQAMLFKKDMNKWQISEVLWWFKVIPIKEVHITDNYKRYRIREPTNNFTTQHTKFGAIIF